MKRFTFILWLFFLESSLAGFPPMTDIMPDEVRTGQEVFIGYDPLQDPCLEALPNFEGLTEYIEVTNNSIEITISGLGLDPCLNIGVENPPYQYFSLGTLSEGDYTVQMYWSDTSTPLPVPPNLNRLPLGEVLTFSVLPPPVSQPVPISNLWTLLVLILGVIMIACLAHSRKNNKISTLMLFIIFSSFTHAKTFHIMLSAEPGAPTADQLVQQASTSPSPPSWMLSSFNQQSPENVEFLISERPFGNRLNIVNSSPNWVYVVKTFWTSGRLI